MSGRPELRTARRLATRPGRADSEAGRHTRRRRLRGLWPVVLALIVLLGLQPAARADEAEGLEIYDQYCQACHQTGATGIPGTFPPLAGNPALDDPDYFGSVLADGLAGELVVGGVTYNGQMPAFPQLSAADVDSLLAYLRSLQAPGAGSPAPPVLPPRAGDPVAGEQLFLGSESFGNGGAACFGCHSAGGHRGARLGPDLTGTYGRLGGEAGLSAWLSAPPSPTMQPLFSAQPITDGEIAHLVAFLATTDRADPGTGADWMLIGGLAGLGGLFALMALVFKRPQRAYADRLRSRS